MTESAAAPRDAKKSSIWQSIRDRLTEDLAAGHYAPGDKLPTEAALSARFGVNRHTVRRALAEMAEDGLVHARRGAGVFVAQRPTDYPIGRRVRFHHNMRAAGRLPSRQRLSFETRAADAEEAAALKLAPGAMVHISEGISLSDDQPIAVFRAVFPAQRFPHMGEVLARIGSVTEALREQGVPDYTRTSTRITATAADAMQALHLRLREGAPLIFAVSINVDPEGVPVEFGHTWFAGERITLTLHEDEAG